MKKFFISSNVSQMVSFDPETESIDAVPYMHTRIDWIYQVPEDGIVSGEGIEKKVKKGDFVIKFYKTKDYDTVPFVVVNNKEWKKNVDAEIKYQKSLEEKLAKMSSVKENCGCDCNETCEAIRPAC